MLPVGPKHYDRPVTDDEVAGPSPLEYVVRAAGAVVVTAAAVVFAVVEAFLVPFTLGGVYVPVAAVLAVAVNLSLPRLALWLVRLRSLALLPSLTWFVIVILGTVPTSAGDLVIHDAWPGMALLLGGAASVAISGYRIVTGPTRAAMKS
ncbi:mutlidrug resistance protein [Stackebrandtia nassauensis DSM 44728]|uniref:Mutlidrug resistance protein n=1 Tax=Stackebrandtia nassauensis (strain DSM 44728 / CIP 108903 / NRRL B-16338 / NBRC 102104 / LLR-40K-21) TaxID=446470 RepID=D3PW15_STANL|nr:mutlidrug resistance protein [Stackebrandtia nassauensis DSM 44728]